jgi:hypothetical protein
VGLQIACRIDEHNPLAGGIVKHDLASRFAAPLGRGWFEKVPGDPVAKQRQAPRDRLLPVVGEDLALHAKPAFLGGLRCRRPADSQQKPRQNQAHDGR